MKSFRVIAALVLLLIVGCALWLWRSVPVQVDLADYAPADAVVYVEFNDLGEVARAIQNTDAWRAAAPITHSRSASQNRLLHAAARAGLAPIDAVLFARTQVALVVVGLDAAEYDQTLHVRPEIALIAETHTTGWRTRPAAFEAVRQLAKFAYGVSACTERSADAQYIECSGGERKIVGAVDGSLVILGNSDNAVKRCLDVRRGVRPSIHNDSEFLRARYSVAVIEALGFGYISSKNSAKLFSWAAPMLMGAAPGDQRFEQLLAASAGKILRGIAWTAVPSRGGIEDRFIFSLEPDVVKRLQPAFQITKNTDDFWKLVPGDFESLTIYRSSDLSAAWNSLNSAVSFKLDALPAVFFGSLLKSSLAVYGIDDPKEAFYALGSPLLTMKLPAAEGSVLIAYLSPEAQSVNSIERDLLKSNSVEIVHGWEAIPGPPHAPPQPESAQPRAPQRPLHAAPVSQKEFMAVHVGDHLIIGKTENVRSFLSVMRNSEAPATEEKKNMQSAARESTAAIVTYANDKARLNSFFSTLLTLQGRQLTSDELAALQNTLQSSAFSATETRLGDAGIERKTRSAFGQFSTLISLLQPGSSSLSR